MAIVELQKLSICADKKKRKRLLERLQSLGIMQIENEPIDDPELQKMDTESAIATFEKNADSLDQVIALLGDYAQSTKSGGLFSEKTIISREQFETTIENQKNYMRSASRILAAQKEIEEARGTIEKDRNRLIALQPWMKLDVPLKTTGTNRTALLIGTIPGELDGAALYAAASKGMEDPAPVDATVLAREAGLTYVAVLSLKAAAETVENNLRDIGFAKPQQMESGLPQDISREIQEDIKVQKQRIESCSKEIAGFARDAEQFRIASDYYRTRAEKYRLLGTIPQSDNVFFLEGWVQKDQAGPVKNMLELEFGAFVELEETTADDFEPTLLKNNAFSESVEGVLESYGLPMHHRVDPTFVMSLFYVFFFGMMLSDAGYGIVMAVACAVLLIKKKRLESSLRKMLKLFFWCGLSTTFWGFMYGGFFGDAIDVIAKTFFGYSGDTLLRPIWFAPLNDPMRLLVWCLLFGLIHLFAGLGMKGYEMVKAHDIVGLIGDVIAWYLFIVGLVLLLIPSNIFSSIAGQSFSFPAWVGQLSGIMAIAGLVLIILLGGRAHKNWAVRIALGAYDVYGVTGWLSDLLSYSRLLALGLATGVIANVVNMMASMVGGGPVGVIPFILVFLLGHTMNIAINALGAYVHTNRLQYVEFFGKFYDAGGRAFQPFHTIHKYIQIKEGKKS
jgi:V/A-type H+-transporting ATPase subunit I